MFDVTNKKDVELFKKFMVDRAWGPDGCPFILEQPYLDIPEMIKDKITHKHLDIKNDRISETQ